MFEKFDPDDDQLDKIRDIFSPAQVDQSVRQAFQMCWMMLPKEKRNIDEVERQFRRIADRAIENLREDSEAFGGASE